MKKNNLLCLAKDKEGIILLEGIIMLLILVPMFLGFVEISSYIRVREKLARSAQEVSHIIATMPHYDEDEVRALALRVSTVVASPHGVSIALTICEANTKFGMSARKTFTHNTAENCGWGSIATVSTGIQAPLCDAAINGLGDAVEKQYIVVSTSCQYAPIFTVTKNFIGDSVDASYAFPFKWDMFVTGDNEVIN